MLRQLRTEARLTQEELAEQAGLSPRSVSDLERGINRTARRDLRHQPNRCVHAFSLSSNPWVTPLLSM